MVALVERLRVAGHTYESQGSVYFRIDSFPDYGCLSGIDLGEVRIGDRVDADEYEKDGKNPPRTTIQQWESKDPVDKVYCPQSREVAYPRAWVTAHWNAWSPRQTKRNTST